MSLEKQEYVYILYTTKKKKKKQNPHKVTNPAQLNITVQSR